MQLKAEDSSGKRILTVSKIEGEKVIMDENHPLAGQTISFDVTVTDVREAPEDDSGYENAQNVRCTDDCSICELNEEHIHDHNCGCGCDQH